jgi:hypothetical protein
MLRMPRFLTKPPPVPAVDEHLLKRLIANIKSLSPAEFDFCVDCLTESQAWRLALLRLDRERRQPAADPLPRAANH